MELECRAHTLVADVAVFAEGQVLLVRYRDMTKYDNERGWFLPDDELTYLEHPERAGSRILKEQLGLSGMKPRLDHIESFKGNSGAWHMAFHNKVELEQQPRVQPSAEILEAKWFHAETLPPRDEVAHHGWARHILETMAKSNA